MEWLQCNLIGIFATLREDDDDAAMDPSVRLWKAIEKVINLLSLNWYLWVHTRKAIEYHTQIQC